ncbi:ABC transporter substrate-binding protein [Paenibacillus allorhizosphaerae]|uniref:Extracellular solute-binding protein n=1 Tax=Paenibacillus allorhizosphaerae TaxID=2849866 RepID=A0ABN7TM16_9BACL|nr:ABC transporter substrate-binding protein [Paenibacillus allorhizosphaerae]CAG7634163.1 hypothetical protein PAECIP111802_02021 [Paenibacillus allorhizosphaerae]
MINKIKQRHGTAKGRIIRMIAAAAVAAMLPACANTSGKAYSSKETDLAAPAELVFYAASTSMTPELFEEKIAGPVRTKYPQYTLKYIPPGTDLTGLITAGTVPDILWLSLSEMRKHVLQLKLQYDLTELITKNKYDLSRFDPSAVQTIRNVSGDGKIFGLPDSFNPMVLFYNKDVFDRFGVPYPTNGMTWDGAYELARKLTRTDSGVSYRGMGMFYRLVFNGNQLSLPLIDASTAKPLAAATPNWKRLLDSTKRFYEIEGNMAGFKQGSDGNSELNSFLTERNIAMIVSPLSSYNREGFQKLNWDMTAAPTFADLPKVGFQSEPRVYFITGGKHKEQAFQSVTHLLSDEVQIKNNKEGQLTSLKNEEVRKTFGQQTPALAGKNTGAVYFNQFAPTPAFNPNFSTDPATILAKEFGDVIIGKQDVNSALRNTDEKIAKAIEEEKAAAK